MEHYVNSPADEGRNSLEKRENSLSGWSKVLRVVGVSFGLLCTMQSVLNVSLRLQGSGFGNKSDLTHSADVNLMTTSDIRSCPRGWRSYTSSCYQLSTVRQVWRHAKEDCVAKGAHLVILNDAGEEDFLHTLGSSDMWIGLRGQLWTWTWVDRSRLTDVNRIQLQAGGRRYYCVYSQQHPSGSVTWVSAACDEQHRWVCEKEQK